MQIFLSWTQIVICIVLILSVLFQDSKNAPQTTYGGNSQTYFKPRGTQAFLNNLTKISGIALLAVSIISLIVK